MAAAAQVIADTQRRWQVVLEHRQRLVLLARSRGAGPDSEDIAHDALLRAVRHLELDERTLWPYLATIAVNRLVDMHRRADRELALQRHASLIPRPRSYEDEAGDRADVQRLLVILRASESRDTVAMVLRRAAGLSWGELADEFGVSASLAETRVRRALLRLRRRRPWKDLAELRQART